MGSYTQSLDPKLKEIRLLVLQPKKSTEPIQCASKVVSLLNHPEFEALSYVWGDVSVKHTIIFDGSPFPVTENLAVALRYLCLPDKPRTLWIDALCINQTNVKERNEQVQLMGEVYAGANPVLIWLGEAEEGTDEGFDLGRTVISESKITEEIERNMFSFYLKIVARKWFTRLWTVQELALAVHDPLVGCGLKWMPWSAFLKAWQIVAMSQFKEMGMVIPGKRNEIRDDSSKEAVDVRPNAIKIDLLDNLRTAVTTRGGESLRSLLLNTQTSQATDPKDRIYGLLGMMRNEDKKSIIVDYDRKSGHVFAEAVAHLFQKGDGLSVISGMELAGSTLEISFPSWVPKFGGNLNPIRFHPPGIGVSGAGSQCVNGKVDEDMKTLRVRGMHIDVVVDKIAFGQQDECLNQLPQVEALVNKAHALAVSNTSSRPYLTKFKGKEPVWRTLIANKAYSGAERRIAPDSYGEVYKKLLEKKKGTAEDISFEDTELFKHYKLSLLNHLPSECFFITETGFYGIGQRSIQQGDHLAIWFGSPVPFVIRPVIKNEAKQQHSSYTVHGVAYVAGIMDGEIVDEIYCEDLEDDVVFIIE